MLRVVHLWGEVNRCFIARPGCFVALVSTGGGDVRHRSAGQLIVRPVRTVIECEPPASGKMK
jgi:hypothetical protein